MTKRQTYTKEFKIEAVRLLEESEKSGMEILRISANVTAYSGHRDRLAHRYSLARLFLH